MLAALAAVASKGCKMAVVNGIVMCLGLKVDAEMCKVIF